ncbi:hypothetical protein D6D13_00468 [Aureobasidium pullulans]|uniref:Glycosyl transferase CAP10 domain-containing protein n=1 Tax=Aureobasidium pullulans TaxID=5580 RepID=A0A4S9DCZ3_AURPU|nr:hypothetical protein D6D13_00468 [Aureobasidium pullulans]
MSAFTVFTASSFVSSLVIYVLPNTNATDLDLLSTWICCALLLTVCLSMRIHDVQPQDQRYELLETGSSGSATLPVGWKWDGVLLTALPAVMVAAGVLTNTQASQYWLPGLVVTCSILTYLNGSSDESVSLGHKSNIGISVVEEKPFEVWHHVRFVYTILLSSGVAWILYLSIYMEQKASQPIPTGVAFLACMAMIYVTLPKAGIMIKQCSEMTKSSGLVNWRPATKLSTEAFLIATILVAFVPLKIQQPFNTVLSGVMQAIRIVSMFYLVSSGSEIVSATSQLAALGLAQALLQQDLSALFAAAFVAISAIAMCVLFMPVSERLPLWASFLVMLAPVLPFAASMLHIPDHTSKLHPIETLYLEGKRQFEETLSRQSKTPEEAVIEYRRRYQREPPAGFDEWAKLALRKGLVLIDEFDGMTRAFDPFLKLDPSILTKVLAATPRDLDELVEVKIKNTEITWTTDRGGSYFGEYLHSWLTADTEYASILPNTTILINTYDEPKTVMPVEMLVDGIQEADYEAKIEVVSLGRQDPWSNVTLSCAESSPARGNTYSTKQPLQFVSNLTESQDLCTHRKFGEQYALLNSPETLRLIHAPLPVWSQAIPSSFQDIFFPSPYYEKHWGDYNAKLDSAWDEKHTSIYWAGATTGGHNTASNWRNMQRQRMVLNTMPSTSPHNITLLEQSKYKKSWKQVEANSTSLQNLMNIFIGNVGQCEEPTCSEMKHAFAEKGDLKMSASYAHKYVLDIDGNGFSGRYYRLLRSHSAVVKQTILKEWHDDWLMPWVHFIPLSLEGNEIWEMMRFLGTTERGEEVGADIAKTSSEWAGKVLRRVDMELVVLRLVLEYARLFDRT